MASIINGLEQKRRASHNNKVDVAEVGMLRWWCYLLWSWSSQDWVTNWSFHQLLTPASSSYISCYNVSNTRPGSSEPGQCQQLRLPLITAGLMCHWVWYWPLLLLWRWCSWQCLNLSVVSTHHWCLLPTEHWRQSEQPCPSPPHTSPHSTAPHMTLCFTPQYHVTQCAAHCAGRQHNTETRSTEDVKLSFNSRSHFSCPTQQCPGEAVMIADTGHHQTCSQVRCHLIQN